MSLMDLLDDFVLGPLNYIDRIEWLAKAAIYRDIGYQFAIPRSDKAGKHTLNEVEDLLSRYGIDVYGRSHDSRHMYFHVKRRQARWAEYVLLNAGVELENPTFDKRNPGYAAEKDPGWMPTPWSERGRSEPYSTQEQPVDKGARKQQSRIDALLKFLNS